MTDAAGNSQLQIKRPQPVIVDGIVYNCDAEIIAWVNYHLGGGITAKESVAIGALKTGWDDQKALSDLRQSLAAGAYFFDEYNQDSVSDITMSIHIEDVESAARSQNVKTLFNYPFGQLDLRRVSAIVFEDDHNTIRLAERIGFKLEGRRRKMAGPERDALMYGLLREECEFWS